MAYDNDITIIDADDLSPTVPDTTMIKTKAIIMNPAFEKVDYAFRLAHELSHILYGDKNKQAIYHFSEFCKRGEELMAHRHAIDILMKIAMPTSPFTFMNYYNIPEWLGNDVAIAYDRLN